MLATKRFLTARLFRHFVLDIIIRRKGYCCMRFDAQKLGTNAGQAINYFILIRWLGRVVRNRKQ